MRRRFGSSTLRKDREVGDEREFRRTRGLDQRRVEPRERQLAAARELEVNGIVGREVMLPGYFVRLTQRHDMRVYVERVPACLPDNQYLWPS